MAVQIKSSYDVIVIGGGPGGATTATLLAKAGKSVLLVEKCKFPRYHIGESLVPGVVPILAELDVLSEMEQYGFTDKFGITLIWGNQNERWSVGFDEAGGESLGKAFQVVRSEFDYLLLQNARRKGVTVLEETAVRDVIFDGDRCTGITLRDMDGEDLTVSARYVVDASGQANLIGRKQHNIEVVDGLKNKAVWAYYQNATVPEGRDAGNIIVENNISEGWLWMIPLHDGTHSIGLVAPQESFKGYERGALLNKMLAESEHIKGYLKDATRVSDYHSHKDWSYSCSQFQGPGYLMVGDAAGFVDPLFSTGVFLAMNSGSLAAKTIIAAMENPSEERALGVAYETSYRSFLDVVTSFVLFFYDASKNKEKYFDRARDLVDPMDIMTARQDFVYLITGLGGLHSVMGMSPSQALEKLNNDLAETRESSMPELAEA
ncbi:MAG: NAD(P)/FAD-dependent oxidoreductase [Reinekea sp.]|nr:NAD(P)/FAD-dependent oxidoreductase [Reinekea sp.]